MSERPSHFANSQSSAFNTQPDAFNPRSNFTNLQPFLPSAGMGNTGNLESPPVTSSVQSSAIQLDTDSVESKNSEPPLSSDTPGSETNHLTELAEAVRGAKTWFSSVLSRVGTRSGSVGYSGNDLGNQSHSSESATKPPLVGIIDTSFTKNSHGAEIQKTISGLNPDASIWQGEGVGKGRWAESLNEFVEVAEASGQPAIANLSFDLTQVNPDGSTSTRYQLTADEQGALAAAEKAGIPVFVSIGNEGNNRTAWEQANQQFDNLVVIGGAEGRDRASTSSYGNHLDLLAPNRLPNHSLEGTSLATAYATGVASNVWAENPQLSDRQLEQVLKSSAIDLNIPGWDAETGSGLINPMATMQQAKQLTPQSSETSHRSNANMTWQHMEGAIATERPNRLLEGSGTGAKPVKHQSSPYQGMSANAAEKWIEAKKNPDPQPSPYRNMSANAAERWNQAKTDSSPSSNPKLMKYEQGASLVYDPAVAQWQQRMKDRDYDIVVDGLYGQKSEQVARKFQEDQRLTIDGVVGEETWNATFSSEAIQPVSIAAIDHSTATAAPPAPTPAEPSPKKVAALEHRDKIAAENRRSLQSPNLQGLSANGAEGWLNQNLKGGGINRSYGSADAAEARTRPDGWHWSRSDSGGSTTYEAGYFNNPDPETRQEFLSGKVEISDDRRELSYDGALARHTDQSGLTELISTSGYDSRRTGEEEFDFVVGRRANQDGSGVEVGNLSVDIYPHGGGFRADTSVLNVETAPRSLFGQFQTRVGIGTGSLGLYGGPEQGRTGFAVEANALSLEFGRGSHGNEGSIGLSLGGGSSGEIIHGEDSDQDGRGEYGVQGSLQELLPLPTSVKKIVPDDWDIPVNIRVEPETVWHNVKGLFDGQPLVITGPLLPELPNDLPLVISGV